MSNLIKPHGLNELSPLFISDESERKRLIEESKNLKKIMLNSSAASNSVMLGAGYFTPLTGYMDKENALSVAKSMITTDGLFWPVPILNLSHCVAEIKEGDQIALLDPNVDGNPPIAIQEIKSIEELSDDEMNILVKNIFGTDDISVLPNHGILGISWSNEFCDLEN